jgi:hypothetical protein
MPEISRFYGIVIFMNYVDHNPAHFHARYQGDEILYYIQDGVIEGRMSQRAISMVIDWAKLHKSELLTNWENAKGRKPLNPIQPLV